MIALVAGASGATGKLLVEQLLNEGYSVKAIVRPTSKIPGNWSENKNITLIKANILEISIGEMAKHLADCTAIASCLGHNISLKGVFGKPRKLVTDAVKLLCDAIKKNSPVKPVKFVLMNTIANTNKDLKERNSISHRIAIGAFRLLVPPQSDNEQAAEHLRVNIGQKDPHIEWVAVRPDSLTNEEKVTGYTLHASPIRSGVFNPGKTSRINTANFMAKLISDNNLWNEWKSKMPVVYNRD